MRTPHLRKHGCLLPRLKNVDSARLYRPAAGQDETWPNLAPVLSTKTIDWDLIRQQYDQVVKALRGYRAPRPVIFRKRTFLEAREAWVISGRSEAVPSHVTLPVPQEKFSDLRRAGNFA
jgi:hypothetical protein